MSRKPTPSVYRIRTDDLKRIERVAAVLRQRHNQQAKLRLGMKILPEGEPVPMAVFSRALAWFERCLTGESVCFPRNEFERRVTEVYVMPAIVDALKKAGHRVIVGSDERGATAIYVDGSDEPFHLEEMPADREPDQRVFDVAMH